jgi:hypothetical protein
MSTALIMMTDPGTPEANGRMVHLLKTAEELSGLGDEVAIYLHGAGVNWARPLQPEQTGSPRTTENSSTR